MINIWQHAQIYRSKRNWKWLFGFDKQCQDLDGSSIHCIQKQSISSQVYLQLTFELKGFSKDDTLILIQ